jgi:hypothetical protein
MEKNKLGKAEAYTGQMNHWSHGSLINISFYLKFYIFNTVLK